MIGNISSNIENITHDLHNLIQTLENGSNMLDRTNEDIKNDFNSTTVKDIPQIAPIIKNS